MKAKVRYSCSMRQIEDLIDRYTAKGGECVCIEEGCLGLGTLVLAPNNNTHLAWFVVREYYLNEWSSGHYLTKYNHEVDVPKKYMR